MEIAILFALIVLNGLFAMSEISLVTARKDVAMVWLCLATLVWAYMPRRRLSPSGGTRHRPGGRWRRPALGRWLVFASGSFMEPQSWLHLPPGQP